MSTSAQRQAHRKQAIQAHRKEVLTTLGKPVLLSGKKLLTVVNSTKKTAR